VATFRQDFGNNLKKKKAAMSAALNALKIIN
jgi:hypothetical protein